MAATDRAPESSEPRFFRVAALDDALVNPAGKGRLVAGDRLMALFGAFVPGAATPIHDHPHEQLTYVLEGTVRLQVEEETHDLGPGEGAVIPGGVSHGVVHVGPQGARIIEVFTPVREDYRLLMRSPASD